MRRVVITGVGVVAPNGVGKDAFWQACVDGHSGIGPIRSFDAPRLLAPDECVSAARSNSGLRNRWPSAASQSRCNSAGEVTAMIDFGLSASGEGLGAS